MIILSITAFPFAGGVLPPAHSGGPQAGQYSMITAQSIDALGCALLVGNWAEGANPSKIDRERQNCQRVEMMLEAMRKYSGVWGSA